MDKNLAGLIGAMGALAVAGPQPAAAAPLDASTALEATSYADLLKPIPNALALWKSTAAAEIPADEAGDVARVETVQYHDHHHHHHHHHRRHRRIVVVRPDVSPPFAHHHHHHHHAAVVVVPPQS